MQSGYDPNDQTWPPPIPPVDPEAAERSARTRMLGPPPLRQFARYPVTTAVALAAACVTAAWHLGLNIDWAFLDGRVWHGQEWRLVTSALPHVDLWHVFFNLYWLWVFGTWVERVLGRAATIGIVVLFAAGSAAADYGLSEGGVGLSGVGYGLCALLWVLQRHDKRFARSVDAGTVKLFAYWFLLCCVLTEFNVWHVGNVAHASGAVLGALLGAAITASGPRRLAWTAALAATLALSTIAASVARPYVNFTGGVASELARQGMDDFEHGRFESASARLREAIRRSPNRAEWWWYNLAVTEMRLDHPAAAEDALRHTLTLNPSNTNAQKVLADIEAARALAAPRKAPGDGM